MPALVVATLGYGLVLLDVTIVNVALEPIARGLGASRTELQWIVDGYALALASLMLSAGQVADAYGRRRVFGAGMALFGLASAACALAPSAQVLIAGRVLQGIGAAALLPASLALVTAAAPDPDGRSRAIGIWAGLGSLGLVAGPLLGGVLSEALGWRAVFWASVPVCAAALAALRLVGESSAPDARGLDVPGQLAGTVCLAALVAGLIEGCPAALAVSAAALAALIAAERRAAWPMLELRHFRDRAFSSANFGSGMMNLGVLGSLFVLSLLLQGPHGFSPAAAGIRLIPLALPLALIPPFAPRLNAAIGLGGTGAGFLALALLGDGASYAGMAAAVNNTARQTGGAVGVALIGGVAGARGFALGAAALLAGALAVTLGDR